MKLNLNHNDVVAMLFAMQYGFANLSEEQKERALVLYQRLKIQLRPYGIDPNEILNQNREANLANKPKAIKSFYIMDNVGTAKYTVNCHDGVTMNRDGSAFFDIHIFPNKQKRNQFVRATMADGYVRLR